ncbi:MAG: hypothetical protein ACJAZO_001926 [Myxococcota bacterium]|jgi:hypothetical protein
MPDKKLRESLLELRRHMDDPDALDDEARQMLADLHDRIESTLDMTQEAAPVRAEAATTASSASAEFAASYPRLSTALERIAAVLSGMGI